MLQITPSLPAQSFEEIESLVQALKDVIPMFQIDIVDGAFAPTTSWPFTEKNNHRESFKKLAAFTAIVPIEIDCMVMHPEKYIHDFYEAGVKSVIVHMGSTTVYEDIILHARMHGYKIGLALTNDVQVSALAPFVSEIDFVQVMGIAHVGAQGQPFDTRTINTLTTLRRRYPRLPLVVDGAVNESTIVQLRDAGATRFAPGSAVAKHPDPVLAYKQLCVLIGV